MGSKHWREGESLMEKGKERERERAKAEKDEGERGSAGEGVMGNDTGRRKGKVRGTDVFTPPALISMLDSASLPSSLCEFPDAFGVCRVFGVGRARPPAIAEQGAKVSLAFKLRRLWSEEASCWDFVFFRGVSRTVCACVCAEAFSDVFFRQASNLVPLAVQTIDEEPALCCASLTLQRDSLTSGCTLKVARDEVAMVAYNVCAGVGGGCGACLPTGDGCQVFASSLELYCSQSDAGRIVTFAL